MLNVLFMGTPSFAVPSLRAILKDPFFNVMAVVTQPDRPAGRGKRLTPPPVKTVALEEGVEVLQPASKGELKYVVNSLNPDVIVVVAYGMILPPEVIYKPPYGAVNLHASLLPKYRGPAPIERAILAGEKFTGNTVILINEKMDEGDILSCETVPIEPTDNRITLADKLAGKGASLLVKTLKEWVSGCLKPEPQSGEPTYAPFIEKEERRICWKADAESVRNRIRAFYPDAYTLFREMRIKIMDADVVEGYGYPGEIISDKELIIACGEGALRIKELISPKGRKVKGEDFLRGYGNIRGEVLK